MLVSELFTDVRHKLSDSAKKRWADDRLIALLNAGLLDLALNTRLFVEKGFSEIVDQVTEVDLSDIAVILTRVQYKERVLPIRTVEDIDRFKLSWQLDEGEEPEAIVINKQNRAVFTIYPIINNAEVPSVEFTSPFGVITGLSYSEIQLILATNFGQIASIPDPKFLVIYFSKKQPVVTTIGEELEIDEFGKTSLIHFITGQALMDNNDDQQLGKAQVELDRYYALLQTLNEKKTTDFASINYETPYNPTGSDLRIPSREHQLHNQNI